MSSTSPAAAVWLTGAGGMLGRVLRAKLEGAGLPRDEWERLFAARDRHAAR